jgi:hypothetical protein
VINEFHRYGLIREVTEKVTKEVTEKVTKEVHQRILDTLIWLKNGVEAKVVAEAHDFDIAFVQLLESYLKKLNF